MDTTQNVICSAINNKRLVQFTYRERIRVVEPYLLGRNTARHLVLSAYLVRGYSASERQPYWREYLIGSIKNLAVLDDKFSAPRKGYNANDPGMTEILCRFRR